MIYKILDIACAFVLTTCVMTVVKWPKMWLPYTIASIGYTIVMFHSGLIGFGIMGIILTISGLNNYRISRRKK
jgi:hypothetical protein